GVVVRLVALEAGRHVLAAVVAADDVVPVGDVAGCRVGGQHGLRRAAAEDVVVATTAADVVVAGAALGVVVAGPAVQVVVAVAAVEVVVAGVAEDGVVATDSRIAGGGDVEEADGPAQLAVVRSEERRVGKGGGGRWGGEGWRGRVWG